MRFVIKQESHGFVVVDQEEGVTIYGPSFNRAPAEAFLDGLRFAAHRHLSPGDLFEEGTWS